MSLKITVLGSACFYLRAILPTIPARKISSKHHIKPLCGLGTCKPFLVALLAHWSWKSLEIHGVKL